VTDARPTALVLRALGLGDLLTGLPALRLIRDALPGHRIVLGVPDAYAPIALLSGTVDHTVHGHELEPLRDPPARPDLAIDLHGNGPASRALLAALRPRRLIAFNHDGIEWRTDEHEVARWCRLVREGLRLTDGPDPAVHGSLPVPSAVVPRGVTVLHCGAKSTSRRWPAERLAALAILLGNRGHDVVITGGPHERQLAHQIGAAARAVARCDLDVLQLLALVANARLVVSGDTGVAHVASAYGTPSVVLFGPVDPARWGPPSDARHQVLWHGDGTGDPHADRTDPALLRISVAEVLDASARALSADLLVTTVGGR
jgi:ADP-heptose:LPS heptosyltransferase